MEDETIAHIIMISLIIISALITMIGFYIFNITENIIIGILSGLSFSIGIGAFFFLSILYLAVLDSG
jgi:hypothetical protein